MERELAVEERELCHYCSRPLTHMQAFSGGVCWDARCQSKALDEVWGALRTDAAQARSLADPSSYFIILVSPQQRKVIPPPPERGALFREHLTGVLHQTIEREIGHEPPLEIPSDPAPVRRWLGAICAACRGDCCVAGRDRAFLDGATLRRQMTFHREGERAAAEVVEAYLRRVPARSVEGSCLFHGEEGCSLPREERASICNTYECAGLRMARRLQAFGEKRRAFVLAEEEGAPVEWTFVSLEE